MSVGEIDTSGHYHIDSLFWHRHNAEKWAKLLLARGAFRVAIDGIVVFRSKLAEQMDGRI